MFCKEYEFERKKNVHSLVGQILTYNHSIYQILLYKIE